MIGGQLVFFLPVVTFLKALPTIPVQNHEARERIVEQAAEFGLERDIMSMYHFLKVEEILSRKRESEFRS